MTHRVWIGLVAAALSCGPRVVPPATVAPPSHVEVAAAPPREPPSPPPPTGSPAADERVAIAVEHVVAFYEAIAATPTSQSCPDAAAAIDRLATEQRAVLMTVRTASLDANAADVDRLFNAAAQRMSTAIAAIDELAARCSNHAILIAALSQLTNATPERR